MKNKREDNKNPDNSIINSKKQRIKYVIRTYTEVLILGVSYFVFVSLIGFGIPCPIRLITGYKCPGCGTTHMVMALSHGDIKGAYRSNPFVLILLPGIIVYTVYRTVKYIKYGKEDFSVAEKILLIIVMIFTVSFWILRNI